MYGRTRPRRRGLSHQSPDSRLKRVHVQVLPPESYVPPLLDAVGYLSLHPNRHRSGLPREHVHTHRPQEERVVEQLQRLSEVLSVSLGKPTIRCVPRRNSGNFLLMVSMACLHPSEVYSRPISFSILSLPD